ncbi:hypothetical protein GQ457_02G027960 [Hibiscus cannabinus]
MNTKNTISVSLQTSVSDLLLVFDHRNPFFPGHCRQSLTTAGHSPATVGFFRSPPVSSGLHRNRPFFPDLKSTRPGSLIYDSTEDDVEKGSIPLLVVGADLLLVLICVSNVRSILRWPFSFIERGIQATRVGTVVASL